MKKLFGNVEDPSLAAEIKEFCFGTHTQFIVVGPGTTQQVRGAVGKLNWPARRIDDVLVYAVPGGGAAIHG